MFKKLKTLLFEDAVELEEEELYEVEEESENDVYVSSTKEEPVEEPQLDPQPPQEKQVQRIDVDTVFEQQQSKPKIVKPTPAPILERKRAENEKPYQPRAVISPMFGLTEAEMQKSIAYEAMKKPSPNTKPESGVISPMYGSVTVEQPKTTSRRSRVARRDQKVNLTLEEMLNIDNQEDVEFTLFDVELDAKEFQSRENKKTIEPDEPLDDTDGLDIMKGSS